jgi:hypothetical protein
MHVVYNPTSKPWGRSPPPGRYMLCPPSQDYGEKHGKWILILIKTSYGPFNNSIQSCSALKNNLWYNWEYESHRFSMY